MAAHGNGTAPEQATPDAAPSAAAAGEDYEWLQEQMRAANLGGAVELREVEEADADEEDAWQDPTSGALHHLLDAIEYGSEEQALELLPEVGGENVNVAGPDGDTALHLACLYGKPTCARKLLELGADPAQQNPQDKTLPLHDACASGFLDIVELLLEKAPETLNAVDADLDTPLHCAARGDHLEVVKLLLTHKPDVALKNLTGNTPEEEAEDEAVKQALAAAAAAPSPVAPEAAMVEASDEAATEVPAAALAAASELSAAPVGEAPATASA